VKRTCVREMPGVASARTAVNRDSHLVRELKSKNRRRDNIERKLTGQSAHTLTLHERSKGSSASLSLCLFSSRRRETRERHDTPHLRGEECEKRTNGRTDMRARRSIVRRTYRFLNLTYSCIKSFWDLTSLHSLFSPTPSRSHERLERTYVPGGLVRAVALSLFLSLSLIALSFRLFRSLSLSLPCKADESGESGKERAMSAAFHPLSIVVVAVVLPSVTGSRAARADDLSRGAALPSRRTCRSRETAAHEAMLTAPIRHTFAAALVRDPSRTKNRPTLRPEPEVHRGIRGYRVQVQPPRSSAVPTPLRIVRCATCDTRLRS